MAQYRQTRNLEASLIDHVQTEINKSWSGVTVEKSFTRVYELTLPVVCLRINTTTYEKAEVGDDNLIRTAQIVIDLFANDDGQREDLKDYIISILKNGCVYNDYTTEKSGRTTTVKTATPNGRIRVLTITENPINFDIDRDKLSVHDRYRHIITLTVSLGRIE